MKRDVTDVKSTTSSDGQGRRRGATGGMRGRVWGALDDGTNAGSCRNDRNGGRSHDHRDHGRMLGCGGSRMRNDGVWKRVLEWESGDERGIAPSIDAWLQA